MSSQFWAELSSDYEFLFESKIGNDVIIYAGEEPNAEEIHARSDILSARSKYFRAAFSKEWDDKKDGKIIFRKPNILPELFNIILRFIYCGRVELENLQGPDSVLKLLIAVDELNIQPLISHIQEYLIEHQTGFLHKDPISILETVYQRETLTDLWNFCFERICEEPKILLNSDRFIELPASLLELLLKELKRDDLSMDAIDVWQSLLKWCFAQQNMFNDPKDQWSEWSEDDITKVEGELRRFIPLIKFRDIKPTDFFYKVYYYKDILPKDLVHDLLEFHIVPFNNIVPSSNQRFNLDSILIEASYIPIFASWIDKKISTHYNKKEIPYEFKLLYHSSRDEFSAASFHRNCDEKGATIWVAKIQGSTQLIGGYNPLDWNGLGYKYTADSFLFNFTDGRNISTAEYGYVSNATHAVYCNNNYGPYMGNLSCSNSNEWHYNYDNGDFYPNIGIPADFIVEDYKVFQLIPKPTVWKTFQNLVIKMIPL